MPNNSSMLRGSLVTLIAAVTVAIGGCSSSGSGSGDYGYYGSGATTGSGAASGSGGSSGSVNTYVPPTCDQTCQDYLVAYALNDTVWFAWGQNIAGRSTGTHDITSNCPLGGTVHITGTTMVNNGIDVADLTFDFADCANSESVYSLTFTGSVTMQGSFEATTQYAALSFSSSSLEAIGNVDYYDQPAINDTCDLACAQDGTGDAWRLNGKLCGRSFNSDTALDIGTGGSSTGSGGGSTGGSSSGGSSSGGSSNCACYCPDGTDCTNATSANPCGVDSNGIPEACGCPVGC